MAYRPIFIIALKTMILKIIIGLLIWFVVPMFFTDGKRRKRKKHRIIAATCKIIGGVIIAYAVIQEAFL